MIRAFIFDLDGVIVDTAKYHYLAWKNLCDKLNLKFDIQDNELLKGVSRTRSFEIILELNNLRMSSEQIDKYCSEKNDIYLEYIDRLTEDEILPGAKEFIIKAKESGIRIALGSASKNSLRILNRLNIIDLFDAVIDGTKVSAAKPDPEVFLKACEALNVKPEESIVFEDSSAGIVAGHTGKMKTVGVSNNEIRNHCDYFIDGFIGIGPKVLIKKVIGE